MRTVEEYCDDIARQLYMGDGPDGGAKVAKGLIAQAISEALEQAADIADEHNGCISRKCFENSNCPVQIASQIRALKGEP